MKTDKVKLTVLGFSFNQTQSGTYGLVLSEEDTARRLMIVVGAPEAQSIAFKLQNITPPRPLTHDLFNPILGSFDIELKEIFINNFVDGVFHSKLILQQGEHIAEIDSRTSDAVAIALRSNVPIFTTEDIMQKLAVVIDDSALSEESLENKQPRDKQSGDYSLLEIEELEEMLKQAINNEDYELATVLRDIIRKKDDSN